MNFKHVNSALHSPFFNKKVNFFKLGNGIDTVSSAMMILWLGYNIQCIGTFRVFT